MPARWTSCPAAACRLARSMQYRSEPAIRDENTTCRMQRVDMGCCGVGVVLRAGKTFQKLAENDLLERTLASYAMTPGAIYIRGQTHLFKIQESEGPSTGHARANNL